MISKTQKIKSLVISSPRSSSSQNFSQPRTSSRNTRKHCYSSNLPRDRVPHTSGDMEEIVWLVTTGEGEVQQQRPPNFPSPKRRLRVLYLFSRKYSLQVEFLSRSSPTEFIPQQVCEVLARKDRWLGSIHLSQQHVTTDQHMVVKAFYISACVQLLVSSPFLVSLVAS